MAEEWAGARLETLTITRARELMRHGALTPAALTDAALARIEHTNPTLNAFLHVTDRQARSEAFRMAGGEGPLAGIPIGVKDLIDVAGAPTTAGSDFLRSAAPAEQDAEVVRRLRAAGAVIVGKTHLHEYAVGATTVNPHFGPARNPWNPALSPGGSSGGSAAAVAAGLCLGALGTDTGGSVRLPSALTGLTGLRPAVGTIPTEGIIPMSWTLDTVGPMAHSAADVALLMDALVVGVPYRYAEAIHEPVSGLRLGVPVDDTFWAETDVEVVAAVQGAAAQFETLGMVRRGVALPQFEEVRHAAGLISLADAAAYHRERLAAEPERFGADVRARLEWGAGKSAAAYAAARQVGRGWRARLTALLQDECDILLTPTSPLAAHAIEGSEGLRAARELLHFTYPISLSGLPALSAPCGFTQDGLPIGMQLVAREAVTLLRAAHAYQRATRWHERHPQFMPPG